MGQLGSKANKKDEKTEVVESDVSHENVPNENKNVPENEQKLQTKPAMSKKTSAVCAVALPSMGRFKEYSPTQVGNLEGPYDINPLQAALMKRWKANKEFRESGLEAELAKLVLGDNWETRYHLMLEGRCPLAFPDEETFIEFLTELLSILTAQNLSGWVSIRGSSTTFTSVHPEKGIDPNVKTIRAEFEKDKTLTNTIRDLHYFDCKIVNQGGEKAARQNFNAYQLLEMYSDIDLNIKSSELIASLKKSGAGVSSAEVGGNYNQDATMDAIPELWEFKATWGERLQRDISFVGVTSASDSNNYSKHPFTFSIK